jgi:hypothetical protein
VNETADSGSSAAVLITRRKRSGEVIGKVGALATATPGLYVYPGRDECEECLDEGFWECRCAHRATFSWSLVCEAGVQVSHGAYDKADAFAIAENLAQTDIDFTLPLAEVLAAAAEANKHGQVHRMLWPATTPASGRSGGQS